MSSPIHDEANPPSWRSPVAWAVACVLLVGCLIGWQVQADHGLIRLQQLTRIGPDMLWHGLTWLGDTHLALALFVAAALLGRHRAALPALIWSLLPATLVTHALKMIAAAPRPAAVLPPDQLHVIGEVLRHGSFPSGHTVTAFTLAGCWVLATPPARRWAAAAAALPLAAAVGVSRVAVGAHWPLDVAVGALLGWLCAALAVTLARRWPLPPALGGRRAAALGALVLGLTLWMRTLPAEVAPLAWALGGLAVGAALAALAPVSRILGPQRAL
ncbi:PAP2 superfamily protein [Tepidimonas alkaliphilus]|uniref:PAP2 superfamily protein n=1 Tax=Tepidimonas alkaliphilus TaxID=2588942 RepID=A0A554WA11_9BURK|nr:phosphatase PAP2 family protein [Tepidimonas alkaliphilus]TSE20406.1 PAP2 superfamily protein [Tepidimonas alkaliphilus]